MKFKNPFLEKDHKRKMYELKISNQKSTAYWKKLDSDTKALFNRYKYSAEKRGYKFRITLQHFESLTKSRCFYCGAKPYQKQGKLTYMGIDRVDNNKGYEVDNVTSCCKVCNRAKQGMSFEEFQNWLYSIKQEFDERESIWESRTTNLKFWLSRGVQFKKEIKQLFKLNTDNEFKTKDKEKYPKYKLEYLNEIVSPPQYEMEDSKRYEKELSSAIKRMMK